MKSAKHRLLMGETSRLLQYPFHPSFASLYEKMLISYRLLCLATFQNFISSYNCHFLCQYYCFGNLFRNLGLVFIFPSFFWSGRSSVEVPDFNSNEKRSFCRAECAGHPKIQYWATAAGAKKSKVSKICRIAEIATLRYYTGIIAQQNGSEKMTD